MKRGEGLGTTLGIRDIPVPSIEIATPQNRVHFNNLTDEVSRTVTPRCREMIPSIAHTYYRESSARIVLLGDIATAHKCAYKLEATAVRKRIKKTDELMT